MVINKVKMISRFGSVFLAEKNDVEKYLANGSKLFKTKEPEDSKKKDLTSTKTEKSPKKTSN